MARMSGSTSQRLRALLREVLAKCKVPADLRDRIIEAVDRGPGGPGRARTIDYEEVRRMRDEGRSVVEIAEALGVSRAAIYKALRDG